MIGACLGSFIATGTENSGGLWNEFMHARVQMDVSKPLKKKMKDKPANGDPFYIDFKYEGFQPSASYVD